MRYQIRIIAFVAGITFVSAFSMSLYFIRHQKKSLEIKLADITEKIKKEKLVYQRLSKQLITKGYSLTIIVMNENKTILSNTPIQIDHDVLSKTDKYGKIVLNNQKAGIHNFMIRYKNSNYFPMINLKGDSIDRIILLEPLH